MSRTPIVLTPDDLYWPTWLQLGRWALKASSTILVAFLAFTAGSATMGRITLDAYQREIDAREAAAGCQAKIDEGVALVLDATLMARALTSAPASVPRVYVAQAQVYESLTQTP